MHPLLVIPCLIAGLAMTQAEQRRENVRGWFQQLNAPDQATRTFAKQSLMGLRYEELPMLREIVARAAPLRPSQADPLREVVDYLFVRRELQKLPRMANGFLGITLPRVAIESLDENEISTSLGVEVSRLPGFAAYRFLEDGDIIRGIGRGGEMLLTRTPDELKEHVKNLTPGEIVTVRVRRGSRDLEIQFPVDAKPPESRVVEAEFNIIETTESAEDTAAEYWEKTFEPLFHATTQ